MEKLPKILCVENDHTTAKLYKKILRLHGLETIIAYDVDDGLKKFEKEEYMMILTDLSFKGPEGIQLIKQIRKKNKNIPIMVSTGFEDREIMTECFKAGCNNYLLKPFKYEEFCRLIEEYKSEHNSHH